MPNMGVLVKGDSLQGEIEHSIFCSGHVVLSQECHSPRSSVSGIEVCGNETSLAFNVKFSWLGGSCAQLHGRLDC